MTTTVANSAWLAGCIPEYLRFRRALSRVRQEQESILHEILRKNQRSDFGRRHGFSTIRTIREFQQRVPLRDYEGYRGDVERIAAGEHQVLSEERVRLFEPTSGSSGAAKWIPYTASLQGEFQRGIAAWVGGMFLHDPDLMRGPAYWSISPADARVQVTPSGIPVGFADDSEYVGGRLQRRLVQSVMAVPSSVRKLPDIETFWYTTLLHLVRCPDLRFISVWNPSFLTLLVDRLPEFADRLAKEAPNAKFALRAATAAERHALLWPRLKMISCWTDGNAGPASRKLAALFPQAQLRAKGLIATEGFVSLPWEASGGSVLAVRSHFLEFMPVDASGEPDASSPLLAHELEPGQQYSAILTTGGGLYRYHLGDILEVMGREQQCPVVRFVSRRQIADWVGEKLHEAHVARALADVFGRLRVSPVFAMLACDTGFGVPCYVLYLEAAATEYQLSEITDSLECELQQNFHYSYARRLGQLGEIRIFAVEDAEQSYVSACIARGQRAGDVKFVSLDARDGWTAKFKGRFIDTPVTAGNH